MGNKLNSIRKKRRCKPNSERTEESWEDYSIEQSLQINSELLQSVIFYIIVT